MNSMPKDPVMLLSFVNTQLRDNFSSLDDLAMAFDTTSELIIEKLSAINYEYNEALNQFK